MGYLKLEDRNKDLRNDLASEEDYADFLGFLDELGIELADQPGKKNGQEMPPSESRPSLNPVNIYFRDMGRVKLLKKEDEIRLAKQIERGEKIINRALSKTRPAIAHILSLENKLKENPEEIFRAFNLKETLSKE